MGFPFKHVITRHTMNGKFFLSACILLPSLLAASAASKKAILIVDDDRPLTELLVHYLEEEGYETAVAHNGEDALNIYSKDPDRIALVLTDHNMPKKSGQELAKEVLKIRPQAHIILQSGNIANCMDTLSKDKDLSSVIFLAKPFTKSQLIAAVRLKLH